MGQILKPQNIFHTVAVNDDNNIKKCDMAMTHMIIHRHVQKQKVASLCIRKFKKSNVWKKMRIIFLIGLTISMLCFL